MVSGAPAVHHPTSWPPQEEGAGSLLSTAYGASPTCRPRPPFNQTAPTDLLAVLLRARHSGVRVGSRLRRAGVVHGQQRATRRCGRAQSP